MLSSSEIEFIETVAPMAAPAGIGLGVFLLVARRMISQKIFPMLTGGQALAILIIAIISAWSLALISIASWTYVTLNSPHSLTPPSASLQPTPSAPSYPPISADMLKNATYIVDSDIITLQDGKREFDPGEKRSQHEAAIFAYLSEHAFGDLDGDGNEDAVAVLQVTDGGSGIYYYLTIFFNERGSPRSYGPAYVLGDRLEFRSVFIKNGKVSAQLMMHKPDDGLCCPTQFRTLEFDVREKKLYCMTEPCSELD